MNPIVFAQHNLLGQMQQLQAAASADQVRPALELNAQALNPAHGPSEAQANPGIRESFSGIFNAIDAQQTRASEMMADVDAGRSDDLLGTMLESQKASVAFSALVQVRNKLTGAFEEVMRLQM